jgi:hypothetical protein
VKTGILVSLLTLLLATGVSAHDIPDGYVLVDGKDRIVNGRMEVCLDSTLMGCKGWGSPEEYLMQELHNREAVLVDMRVSMGGDYGNQPRVILYYRIVPR